MRQIDLVPNQKYRIISSRFVPNVSILVVTFSSQIYYNKVLHGEGYNKYAHHKKRYAVPVVDNVFRVPDFKVPDKTIFFITPNINVSTVVEKEEPVEIAEVKADVKVKAKEKVKPESERKKKVKTFDATCPLCVLEQRTERYFESKEFTILDCDNCHVPMIVYHVHGKHPELPIISKAHIKGRELFGGAVTFRDKPRKILNHYHEHIEIKVKTGQVVTKTSKYRRRVAFFTSNAYFGGPLVHSYNIIKMFIKNNVDFDIFGFGNFNRKGLLDSLGIHIYPIGSIEFDDYDIFHVQSGPKNIEFLNRHGIYPIAGSNVIPNAPPVNLAFHKDYPSDRERTVDSERVFLTKTKCSIWIAQSRFQEREYRFRGLDWKIPVYIINNPVDVDFYKKKRDNHVERDLILWNGKTWWVKGFDLLEQIIKKYSDQKFGVITEDGGLVKVLGKYDNLEFFVGRKVYELPEILNRGKLILNFSYTENQPLSTIEAMLMNVPVLSNKNSGLSEILNNDNAILVDSGNLEHYCVELNRFLKGLNVEQVERQVDNAREFVEKKFNYDAVMKKYNNVYDEYLKLTE